MAIVNYPERIYKTTLPAIDVAIGRSKTYNYHYSQNLTSSGVSEELFANRNWKINTIIFTFSGATARDFSASIANGRCVVENYNDFLWIQSSLTVWQKIVLTPGFYNGNQLASHLQTLLDANAAFLSAGITFSVTYSATTGLFTITPSTGQIRYINRNLSQVLGQRDSIGGHLFGHTADTSFGATVVSDTSAAGLTVVAPIISQTGNTDTSYIYTTPTNMSIDQRLQFSSGSAAVTLSVDVNYQIEY